MRGLSPVAASGGHSSSRCAGLSLSRPLLLWSTGSRRAGSVAVAHGLSCSASVHFFSLLLVEVVRGVRDFLFVGFKFWCPSGYIQLQVTKEKHQI